MTTLDDFGLIPPATKGQPQGTAPAGGKSAITLESFGLQKPGAEPSASGDLTAKLGSFFRGLAHGVGSLGIEAGRTLSGVTNLMRAPTKERTAWQSDLDAFAQQRAQEHQQQPYVKEHPGYARAGELTGEIAPTLAIPGGALVRGATSIPRTLAGGAAMGAAAGATQPTTAPKQDFWGEKLQNMAVGGAVGGTVAGVGRAIGPPLTAAAQAALKEFPLLSGLIRGTAARSMDNFNLAAVNQTLDPIGIRLPPTLKAGHGLINAAQDAFSDAYDRELPRLSLRGHDPQFSQEIADLKNYTGKISAEKHQQLVTFIENHLEKPLLAKGGALDGAGIKKIESSFSDRAASYVRATDPDQKALGHELYEAREAFMDAVTRQNPAAAAELKKINQGYAMFARVREAAGRKVDAEGVFRPVDLLHAAQGGKSGRASFAKGDQLMQAFGEAANAPMNKSLPKVNRILTEIVGAGLGAGTHGPFGAGVGAVAGAAAPEIARGVVRATQHPISRGLGTGVSRLAPAAGAGAARAMPESRSKQRLKAAQKVGEVQQEIQRKRYAANRRSDFPEMEELNKKLVDARQEYRDLGGTA